MYLEAAASAQASAAPNCHHNYAPARADALTARAKFPTIHHPTQQPDQRTLASQGTRVVRGRCICAGHRSSKISPLLHLTASRRAHSAGRTSNHTPPKATQPEQRTQAFQGTRVLRGCRVRAGHCSNKFPLQPDFSASQRAHSAGRISNRKPPMHNIQEHFKGPLCLEAAASARAIAAINFYHNYTSARADAHAPRAEFRTTNRPHTRYRGISKDLPLVDEGRN